MTTLADKFTVKVRREIYSDFKTTFELNPVTGFLAKDTNEVSVKKAIRNIIMTTNSERFQRSDIGSKVKAALFEPVGPLTEELIKTSIVEAITNHEPRALLHQVDVTYETALNSYNVTIYFGIVNIPNQSFDLNITLERVR